MEMECDIGFDRFTKLQHLQNAFSAHGWPALENMSQVKKKTFKKQDGFWVIYKNDADLKKKRKRKEKSTHQTGREKQKKEVV